MPRYFFHTRIAADTLTDEDGVELRDPDQAWRVARATIRASLEDEGGDPRLVAAILVVTDEAGEVVLEFPFAEAIDAADDPAEPGEGTLH
ncbi:hypothetical protein C0214_03925 [Methylobacterium sp. DM1]|uniref:DUF6894 domain-containing protein n=1 Tax=Methylorubrum aminovorans TaxID=269069 RepID=A0ABQ4UEG7_9HYPH|nr:MULTISPECIES: hypothetical protein [Methylobacteriaceae]AWI87541.1 hypothetical protein C0214_03925 [Methylobacterium sp. DM1]HEV2541335.1 hypothetical protein [Methylobacterium sp.]QIJ73799.1 hypothetical protein CLZ_03920 [Methylobacterium sp. CLZ]QIJ78708.1 hypothetical protein GU700_03920 [Methylobacterium sp. NI91]UGB26870.1 hypothetical protein LPC10_04495 [Methylorubrum sp. B1-46]